MDEAGDNPFILTFTGRIFPKAIDLCFETGATCRWVIEPSMIVEMQVRILHSEVTVTCHYEGALRQEHLSAVYVRALDVVRATVDLLSFSIGRGLIVILDHVKDRFGTCTEISPEEQPLGVLCTAYGLDAARFPKFLEVYKVVLEEPAIFMALNDLVAAITYPHHGPVNCGRAVEGIRHLMGPGLPRKQQWPIMNDRLRLTSGYSEFIMEHAKAGRHGDRTHVPGATVREAVHRSWTIMNRFLEYKKRGGQAPLPLAEFAELS
jgi:hypothetical protein